MSSCLKICQQPFAYVEILQNLDWSTCTGVYSSITLQAGNLQFYLKDSAKGVFVYYKQTFSNTFITNTSAKLLLKRRKKVFLKLSQNSQKNTCANVYFQCFPVHFAKNVKNTFLKLQRTSCGSFYKLSPGRSLNEEKSRLTTEISFNHFMQSSLTVS